MPKRLTRHRHPHKPHPFGIARLVLITLLLAFARPSFAEDWLYTVRPGDTLSSLAKQLLQPHIHWRQIQHYNQIAQPNQLKPGTKLRMAVSWLKIQPIPARLLRVTGKVSITPHSAAGPQPMEDGESLHIGDKIQTHAQSSAVIEFADGSRLTMQPDTIIHLDTLSNFGASGMIDTKIRLPAGRIEVQANPHKKTDSRFEITTPAAVAAVRGTDFRIAAEDGRPVMRGEVLTGQIEINSTKIKRALPAGYGLVTSPDAPPRPPIKLLSAPGIVQQPAQFDSLPIAVHWQPVAGASHYRVQLLSQTGTSVFLNDQTVPSITHVWPDLTNGEYRMRVRAIDQHGLEGYSQDHSFIVRARPFAPQVINSPTTAKQTDIIHHNQPQFTWSAVAEAVSYRVQLARQPDFSTPLQEQTLTTTQHATAPLPTEGRYYWRVAGTDKDGRTGPYSKPQSFQYVSIAPPPELSNASISDDSIQLTWSSVKPVQRYQLQIAHDAQFDALFMDQIVTGEQVSIARPAAQRYFTRVRALHTQGITGPYSNTIEFDVPPASYWPMLLFAVPLLFL